MINTLLRKQKHDTHIILFFKGLQLLRIGLFTIHDTLSSLISVYFRLFCPGKDLELLADNLGDTLLKLMDKISCL